MLELVLCEHTGLTVEEPISISHTAEGEAKDARKGGTKERVGKPLLCQSTNPQVERLQGAIELQETHESELVFKVRDFTEYFVAEVPPDGVRGQSVFTPALKIEGSEIKRDREGVSKELSGEDTIHKFVHPSRVDTNPTPSYGVSTQADPELVWVEESIHEIQRANWQRLEVDIKTIKLWTDQTVSIAVGSRSEAVRNARVYFWIVSFERSNKEIIILVTENFREVVFVCDFLN